VRDSRKNPRARPLDAAPVRVDIRGEGFLEVLVARDISVGGIGVFVPHDFHGCDLDSEVDLIVKVGTARPFKTRGVIRHRAQQGAAHFYGVEFVGLAPEQQEVVAQYVESCLRGGRKLP
jgi:hypothetical protein